MRKIGLIGGMSWESSITYYRRINEEIRDTLGGLHSADCLLHSVDFAPVETWQRKGEWNKAGQYLGKIAQNLESAGAEGIILCTNTMHKVADYITSAIHIPFLHIGEVTGNVLRLNGHRHVLLLGTKYTMSEPFMINKLEQYGLYVTVPEEQDMEEVNRIIFEELCLGISNSGSKKYLQKLINKYKEIDSVVLGCTELNLLLDTQDTSIHVYDSAELHILSTVEFILKR
ncbi:aspartate/glutamate racemase family protein [Evansella tamaricis]|uniref:Aspartate/glutamate racemase family protein n=1 Tax=Evansella tamaricis TaxID=2069301 RepID=A0ABS6JFB1_9BACI|nr:aspartate/glutamate racemase family protein [Evansella tamaricis]MBU9711155.1 aspartate/glutamate racemase family protein [Evansella tamaricis]